MIQLEQKLSQEISMLPTQDDCKQRNSHTQAISTISACNSYFLTFTTQYFIDISVFLKHNFKNLQKNFIPKATYPHYVFYVFLCKVVEISNNITDCVHFIFADILIMAMLYSCNISWFCTVNE